MAIADHTIEEQTPTEPPKWPFSPEDMLALMPKDLAGSPAELLSTALIRAEGIIAVLGQAFGKGTAYQIEDQHVSDTLEAAQGFIKLAQALTSRLAAGPADTQDQQ